jgi:phage shock protein A
MIIISRNGEDEMAPVRRYNDNYFLCSQYRADPEFAATLQQNMANPSHHIRALQHSYGTCHSSQVEMVARLNQLQAYYAHVKQTGKLMKLKKTKESRTG